MRQWELEWQTLTDSGRGQRALQVSSFSERLIFRDLFLSGPAHWSWQFPVGKQEVTIAQFSEQEVTLAYFSEQEVTQAYFSEQEVTEAYFNEQEVSRSPGRENEGQ